MFPINKEYNKINYKKITWKDFDKIKPETLKDMAKIDNLSYRTQESLGNFVKNRIKEKSKTIFYLMYNDKELIGAAIGDIRKVSKFGYTNKNKKGNYFYLSEAYISTKHQNKGLGNLLISRVVADQRVNHKTKFVNMIAFRKTQNINKKITGKRPLIFINGKTKTPKNVLRSFKNSRIKYNLHEPNSIYQSHGSSNSHTIYINKNKKRKRRVYRPRVR